MSVPKPDDSLPTNHAGTHPLLSVREFERLPEDPFWRYELVRGRVVREPPPGEQHGSIAAKLAHLLLEFVGPRGLGDVRVESGYVLSHDPDTVRGPDVSFVRRERLGSHPTGIWPHVPPDLAVEVLSPSGRAGRVKEKVDDYLAAGCRLVWVVDPQRRTVVVYESSDEHVVAEREELDGGTVLPGFRLPVTRLFS